MLTSAPLKDEELRKVAECFLKNIREKQSNKEVQKHMLANNDKLLNLLVDVMKQRQNSASPITSASMSEKAFTKHLAMALSLALHLQLKAGGMTLSMVPNKDLSKELDQLMAVLLKLDPKKLATLATMLGQTQFKEMEKLLLSKKSPTLKPEPSPNSPKNKEDTLPPEEIGNQNLTGMSNIHIPGFIQLVVTVFLGNPQGIEDKASNMRNDGGDAQIALNRETNSSLLPAEWAQHNETMLSGVPGTLASALESLFNSNHVNELADAFHNDANFSLSHRQLRPHA